VVQQIVQVLAFLVEYTWCLTRPKRTNRTNLETLSALIAVVDEMHECVDYPFHWRQESLTLQVVVEGTSADVSSSYMRAHGIKGDILFSHVFAV
jgi:hypothetical protein